MREQGKTNIHLVKNKYGKGALNAIKTGFEAVNDGVVLVAMADLSDDFTKVDEMFRKINQGYDIVCGSRYMRGGKQIGGPLLKRFLSRMAGVSLYYLAGIPTHDATNNFKMYTKKVLNEIKIESKGGFELAVEVVVKAFLKGRKITEVPCVSPDRQAGEAKFKLWKWLPHYLRWYWLAITGCVSGRPLTAQLSIAELIALQAIGWPLTTLTLASLGFWLGIPIGPYHIWAGLLLFLIL